MSEHDRIHQSHPVWDHVVHLEVTGANAVEVEAKANEWAANYFGLMLGDIIPDWLDIIIRAEQGEAVKNGNAVTLYELPVNAEVTVRRNRERWKKWLESL